MTDWLSVVSMRTDVSKTISKYCIIFTFWQSTFRSVCQVFFPLFTTSAPILYFFFNSLFSLVFVLHPTPNRHYLLHILWILFAYRNHGWKTRKKRPFHFFSALLAIFSFTSRFGFIRCKSCDVFNICNLLASEHSFSLCHHIHFDWWLYWWDRSLCVYIQHSIHFFRCVESL